MQLFTCRRAARLRRCAEGAAQFRRAVDLLHRADVEGVTRNVFSLIRSAHIADVGDVVVVAVLDQTLNVIALAVRGHAPRRKDLGGDDLAAIDIEGLHGLLRGAGGTGAGALLAPALAHEHAHGHPARVFT